MTDRITVVDSPYGPRLEFDFPLSMADAKAFQTFANGVTTTERERIIAIIHGFHVEAHVDAPSSVCKPCRIIGEATK